MHELGHTLGLRDVNPIEFPADLMAETLATGERRLLSADDVARVLAADSVASSQARTTVPTGAAMVDAVIERTHGKGNESLIRPRKARSAPLALSCKAARIVINDCAAIPARNRGALQKGLDGAS
jgi:hypothetical protein